MKEFDLEECMKGATVVYRNGRSPIEVIWFTKYKGTPWAVYSYGEERVLVHHRNGMLGFKENEYDLMIKTD